MENKFFKDSFIVYHINPYKPEYDRKTIFLWNCPPLIKNKINNGQFDDPAIKSYFGSEYKKKLGLEKHDMDKNIFHENFQLISDLEASRSSQLKGLVTTGGYDNIEYLKSIDGGDISDNNLIIKSTRDDDIENYTNSDNIPITSESGDIDFSIDFNEVTSDEMKSSSADILDADYKEGNEYIFDISVYPEDNILTLKSKIYIVCKIPIYRQLLFYSGTNIETFHEIYVNDILYNLSPFDDITRIHNMGIDKKLYASRESMRVKSYDEFRLVGNLKHNYICMVDLKVYSDILGINKLKILDDKLYVNVIYYGFIKKYFPMLDFEGYKLYFTNERDLLIKYPILVENIHNLEAKYGYEKTFLDNTYTMKLKDIKEIERNVEIAAKTIKLGNIHNSNINILNMRNVFDVITTNTSIIKLISKFEFNNEVYEITKEHMNVRYDRNINTNFELYKTYLKFKNNGLVLYYCYDRTDLETRIATFVMFPTGKYYIIINNKEEDKTSFNKTIDLAVNIVNKILKIINDNISIVLNKNISNFSINYLNSNIIKFYTLDIIMYLNISMSENKFNKYKMMFNDLNKHGIITLANIQTDNQIFSKISKSVHDYGDRKFIVKKDKESKNYYDAYLDAGANATWKLLFGGKKLNITNSITRVTYEMFNLIPEELNFIYYYLLNTIHVMNALKSNSEFVVNQKKGYIAKSDIKKMEELDPELYAQNLGKDKIYSRIVQKKNRPTIYSIEEYEKMSAKDKAKLNKYWNFTNNEPIYYACEDPKFKHFSFVTGKHPKGFCFPVCRDVKNQGKKMTQLYNTCMTEHCTSVNGIKAESGDIVNILKYKDELVMGKKYYFPDQFYDIFYKLDKDTLYFHTQTPNYLNTNDVYLFKVYVNILKLDVPTFIRDIIKKIKSYSILDFETLNMYFNSIEDLSNSLELHFIKGIESYESYWNLVFEEILLYLYNVVIINIKYDSKMYINLRQDITNFSSSKFIVTFNGYKVIYKKISLFDYSDPLIEDIIDIKNNLRLRTDSIISSFSYNNIVKSIDTKKITAIYVTGKKITHLIYNKNIYIAIYNSPMFESNLNIYNEIYYRDSYKISWYDTYKFVHSLVNIDPTFVIYDKNLENVVELNTLSSKTTVIGMQVGTLYFWFNDTKLGDIRDKVNNFGIEVINFEPSDINELLKNTHKVKNYIDQNLSNINYKIYYNNMFKMYKIATYNHILKNYNNPIKDSILKIISNKKFDDNINTNITDITKMLKHKQDKDMITPIINDYKNERITKDELISTIENNQFIFDLDNIRNFSKMDLSDITSYLNTEGKKYVKLIKNIKLDKNISNIITTCASGSKSEFCENKKLLIIEDQYEDFISVMAQNLRNGEYSYHDIININFNIIIDYFKFNKNPGEVIYLLT